MIDKKIKVVATIGPSSDTPEKIKRLISSGVDVFRFNTKHSTVEWHNERIRRVQSAAKKAGKHIGIMIDLQGDEIRVETRDENSLVIRKGSELLIGDSFCSDNIQIVISAKEIFKKIKPKDRILIDDGLIELEAVEVKNKSIRVRVVEGGVVENRKTINFPGIKIKLPSLIEKDIKNLDSAVKNNVSFVALSFVSSKKDIQDLKKEMKKRGMRAGVVAKIENQDAIKNIDEIIEESDAVMIARGDLGVEVPIEELAYWQKEIIKKCRRKNKPVIVATQMLHSMVNNIRPTRAEATDVANAVFDGTDAVMLSEETAVGKNPIKAVTEMVKIIKFNEEKADFCDFGDNPSNPTEFVVGAVARELRGKEILKAMNIKTAVVFTESGYTAKVISSFRLGMVVVAITNNEKTAEELSLSYGIKSYYAPLRFDNMKIPDSVIKEFKKKKFLTGKETVAIFHGKHDQKPDLLNLFSLTEIK